MIYCKKKDLIRFLGLSSQMDAAICAIQNCDLSALHQGRNELSDGIYGNRFDYVTQMETCMLYENHVHYADIHLLLSGCECIMIADHSVLTRVEERPDEDYIGLKGIWESCVKMTNEDVLIVLPGEAHKPKCILKCPQKVEKFVVKVPMT